MKESITSELQARIPGLVVLTDEESLSTYGTDWTKFHNPSPCAIAFPENESQVKQIVEFAKENKLGLVPSGGRTGLAAAATALNGELVVSFDKMNRMLEFNEADSTVTVEAGFNTLALQEFAKSKGLMFPVDFASKGSSQIGGNIATNAGGIKVVRYGLMREWVTGLKVVTGNGDVLSLNKGLMKNASGYDLRQLFIGSEGTLGFITEATVRLIRAKEARVVMLFGTDTLENVLAIMQAFRSKVEISAFEFLTDAALQYVMDAKQIQAPLRGRHPYYTILEFDGSYEEEINTAIDLYKDLFHQGLIADDATAMTEEDCKRLWQYREDISASISYKTPYKNDLSVRISRIPAFLKELETAILGAYPDFEVLWYGHIADGNVHVNVLKPDTLSLESFKEKCGKMDGTIYGIVEKFEGSVSAEHGVGLLKKKHLGKTRSKEEIEYMKAIKQVFDPEGIMNPGKVV